MTDNTMAAERHPIQGLLDEIDGLAFMFPKPVPGGVEFGQLPMDDQSKEHLKDMLRSAYATGLCRRGN